MGRGGSLVYCIMNEAPYSSSSLAVVLTCAMPKMTPPRMHAYKQYIILNLDIRTILCYTLQIAGVNYPEKNLIEMTLQS